MVLLKDTHSVSQMWLSSGKLPAFSRPTNLARHTDEKVQTDNGLPGARKRGAVKCWNPRKAALPRTCRLDDDQQSRSGPVRDAYDY